MTTLLFIGAVSKRKRGTMYRVHHSPEHVFATLKKKHGWDDIELTNMLLEKRWTLWKDETVDVNVLKKLKVKPLDELKRLIVRTRTYR